MTPGEETGASPAAHDPVPHDAAEVERRRAATEIRLRVERIRVLSEDLRETQRALRQAERRADQAERESAALRRRRVVRSALAMAALARALVGVGRRLRSRGRPGRPAPAGREAHEPSRDDLEGPIVRPRVPPEPTADRTEAQAFRETLLDRLDGGARSAGGPLHVAITTDSDDDPTGSVDGGPARAIGDGLAGLGWEVSQVVRSAGEWPAPPTSVDVVVCLSDGLDVRQLPEGIVTIASTGDVADRWLERAWFDEYDIVLTATEPSKERIDARSVHVAEVTSPVADPDGLREILRRWASAQRIDVAIGPPSWDVASRWGDYHFGRALQRALQQRGHPTRLRLRSDWDGPTAGRADATIQLFGLVGRRIRPGQLAALWIFSHPELVTDALVREPDVVFAASDGFAAALTERTGRPVIPLHQATDPDRFRPLDGGPDHDLLFVANSRGVRRRIVDELTPTDRDMAVYGWGWTPELLDTRYLRGEHVPNDDLAAYYAGAKIVLNDHWPDMAEHGFLSNRLYDAAASGAFVISDRVPGMDEEFDGGIVSFGDGDELRELVVKFLAAPDERVEHARRAMMAVRSRHTFRQRADTILAAFGPAWATGTTAGVSGTDPADSVASPAQPVT